MEPGLSLIVLLLACAVAMVTLFRRLNLPAILAYLLAGLAAGPGGFGWIDYTSTIQHLAEFGIVFLLFSLGLEFSIPKLLSLRRIVFGAGPVQVLATGGVVGLGMHLAGFSMTTSVVTACALSLSSTAIVVRELITRGETNTTFGRSATGILLFQDLAAVIMLVLLPSFGGNDSGAAWTMAGETLLQAALLFVGIFVVGKWILPRLLEETNRARSDEVFVMSALLLALVAAWVTHALGLSMALGAFLAGMMLGESHFRHQIESDIRPFRDLLLGLFFMTVGMLIDPALFISHWHIIILAATVLVLFKSILIATLLRLQGEHIHTALRTGMGLSQAGEFGFVLVTLAVSHDMMGADRAGIVVAITVLTMAVTPALINNSARLARRIHDRLADPVEDPVIDENTRGHVILCGYGRVGQNLARYLSKFHLQSVAIDSDLIRIQEASEAGEKLLFGDAARKEILVKAGINRASLLVITFDDARHAEKIMHTVRAISPDLRILVRTRDDTYLDQLQDAGATEVVPETLEASLMLIAHALLLLDVPFGKVLAMLRSSRRDRYKLLQGYYHGDSFPTMDSSGNPYRLLHAVTLAGSPRCAGKTIADTGLEKLNVEVRAVRREGRNLQDPERDFQLATGDVVILYGALDAVEAGEELLLGG
ncbi:MAG: monovalent cation:proton antiporter-2 (CPA2) family protein [Alcanivoracaceae bacterium]|jgi:CPA2 family monovalent cation:H+ antiporter-2|nr:monovalent cation:proton antiporter-2 (CPA2) family protein [Alcanivoracaceae bacterium]